MGRLRPDLEIGEVALAYLDPGADHPEPAEDTAWALAQALPLRTALKR